MTLRRLRVIGPSSSYLIDIRERLEFTQAAMADALGMSRRAYSDLETGKSEIRQIHLDAAERVALREARSHASPFDILPKPIADDVRAIMALLD